MRAGNGKGKKYCSEGTLGKYILWLKKCHVACTYYRFGMGVAKPGEGLVSLGLVVWEWCAGCCGWKRPPHGRVNTHPPPSAQRLPGTGKVAVWTPLVPWSQVN